MSLWTISHLADAVYGFNSLTTNVQHQVCALFNQVYSPELFARHLKKRQRALLQMNNVRNLLSSATQNFPTVVSSATCSSSNTSLAGCAVVLTAGGEGERLRLSLLSKGYSEEQLKDFSKVTFALPGFPDHFGTLHANLVMIAAICNDYNIDIPVVITTGPASSVTARIIPEICSKYNNFGLKHLRVIEQDERLFFTDDEKIVLTSAEGKLQPVVHPDETGGPIMKLKSCTNGSPSALHWLSSLGCSKTLIVQCTALYHPTLLPLMAAALGSHDCCGVGIPRTSFPENDPYGTFVSLETATGTSTVIIEQDIRNASTRAVTDAAGEYHLPFNTGFFAFNNTLLEQNDLPDFATPPKELRPDLPRSPKIGYAATDLITLAKDPVVLTITTSMYGVLKNADDLATLSRLGKDFDLVRLCATFIKQNKS